MTDSLSQVTAYLDRSKDRFLGELVEFLKIPSVSANPAHQADMHSAARFVHQQLESLWLKTETVATPGHPIVYAETPQTAGAATVVVYGHYDVQPPDPLDLWTTPPFEPTIRNGQLFARGATDDKGQLFTHIKSTEAWLKTVGRLPVNLKFVIEGEEEVGSNNLDEFLLARKEQLKCDVAVISDSSQYGPDRPAITYGLRGILACEVRVTGPKKDLHSGTFGGSVMNPVTGLSRMIAALHDDAGRVQIPGFYDDVLPLTDAERRQFARLPFNKSAYKNELGVSELHGEIGFSATERRWARPTCEINGMFGGYQGPGPKTIVPSKATAKITCRLVPDQNPEELTAALERYLRAKLPPGMTMEFTAYHGAPAFVLDPESPYIAAAAEAITTAFGTAPVLVREGGSIPVVGTFKRLLGVDTLLLGWGQNTDNLHSPDEHFTVADFHRGTLASAVLWDSLARMKTS